MLLYTYATQRPIGTRARSLHVGTLAHVYTVPTTGSPTCACTSRCATVRARAGYTWAHPPTCAPYTAVLFLTSARASVVIQQSAMGRLIIVSMTRPYWACEASVIARVARTEGEQVGVRKFACVCVHSSRSLWASMASSQMAPHSNSRHARQIRSRRACIWPREDRQLGSPHKAFRRTAMGSIWSRRKAS